MKTVAIAVYRNFHIMVARVEPHFQPIETTEDNAWLRMSLSTLRSLIYPHFPGLVW